MLAPSRLARALLLSLPKWMYPPPKHWGAVIKVWFYFVQLV
jgi:hypothetical protein